VNFKSKSDTQLEYCHNLIAQTSPNKQIRVRFTHGYLCAGPNTEPFSYSNKMANVLPFSEEYNLMKEVPIASAVTIYHDPCTVELSCLPSNT
jgi:hypothetical protein